jgi:hypothetical protein
LSRNLIKVSQKTADPLNIPQNLLTMDLPTTVTNLVVAIGLTVLPMTEFLLCLHTFIVSMNVMFNNVRETRGFYQTLGLLVHVTLLSAF